MERRGNRRRKRRMQTSLNSFSCGSITITKLSSRCTLKIAKMMMANGTHAHTHTYTEQESVEDIRVNNAIHGKRENKDI